MVAHRRCRPNALATASTLGRRSRVNHSLDVYRVRRQCLHRGAAAVTYDVRSPKSVSERTKGGRRLGINGAPFGSVRWAGGISERVS